MTKEASMGKARRAIVRSDEGEVRARVARALGCDEGKAGDGFGWFVGEGGRLSTIEHVNHRGVSHGLSAQEIANLASEGIFPGATWEIEVRRELLAPWRWWPFMVGGEFLARSDDNRKAIAFARSTGCDIYDSEDALVLRENIQCASLTEARERAEDECWSRGLFGVVDDAPAVKEGDLFRSKNGGRVWRVAEMTGSSDGGPRWRMAMVSGEPLPCHEVERDLLDPARWTREQADEDPAFPTDAGVEPPHPRAVEGVRLGVDRPTADPPPAGAAALGIYRIACHLIGIDETGFPLDPARPGAARLARLGRLCEAFVADLRASLPVPPMPLPRTTDGALTAYLMQHHRDAWHPGEDALALAIRLLDAGQRRESLADGTAAVHASKMREAEAALVEMTGERDAFAAEARASAATADRLANAAATLRRERDAARERLAQASADRLGAEGERDEARADLATLRQGVAALAAKMGAPHG